MPQPGRKTRKRKATSRKGSVPAQTEKRAKAHILKPERTRRQPRQERARFTVDAVLKAAVEVIDQVGWAHASTNRIAERAGVSIGSLYQYFDGKDAILQHLIEQHHQVVHRAIGLEAETFFNDPGVPIEVGIRKLFQALVRAHQEDPVLTRVLSSEVPAQRAREAYDDHQSGQYTALLQHVLELRTDIRLPHTTAAAHLLVATAEALTRWLAHEAPAFLDKDMLIEEIVVMLSGYVTGPRHTTVVPIR